MRKNPDPGSETRNEHPGCYLELKILIFFDADPWSAIEILSTLDLGSRMEKWIWDPGWKKFDPGSRRKHPGSSTLHVTKGST